MMFRNCDLDKDEFNEDNFSLFDTGEMTNKCKHCESMMFLGEKLVKSKKGHPEFGMCCGNGKFKVPFFKKSLPKKLVEYLTQNTKEARFFRKHIRTLNSAFRFTSFGCNENIHSKCKYFKYN